MGVIDTLSSVFGDDDSETAYECIACGAGYESSRRHCPACGSEVERK